MKALDKIAQELRMKTELVKLFQKYPGSWQALGSHISDNDLESANFDDIGDYILDALSVSENDDDDGLTVEFYLGGYSTWKSNSKGWTYNEEDLA